MDYTNIQWGWTAVGIDLTARNFQYRLGEWVEAKLPEGKKFTTKDIYPSFEGGGLCISRTFASAWINGKSSAAALYCGYYEKDILALSSCHTVI